MITSLFNLGPDAGVAMVMLVKHWHLDGIHSWRVCSGVGWQQELYIRILPGEK